ncbi:MAG TPA: alanine racemase [Nitriliruptorales bacterium]
MSLPPLRPTRAEIDLDAIRHNVRVLREAAGGTDLCAVVKADGYGHGAVPVARAALEAGAAWLAVALVEEGEELRAAGIDAPVLLLSEPPAAAADRLLAAGLTSALYTRAFGAALDAAAARAGTIARVHLKADTGMHRVGVYEPDWRDVLEATLRWEHVEVEALWTHLARADEPDSDSADRQLDAFDRFLALAAQLGIEPGMTHAANSAATLRLPRAHRDLLRTGVALYGLSPDTATLPATAHGLRQALRLVTQVSFVKQVPAGTAASYGHTWRAPAAGWLATVAVGYADGVPRLLSNRAEVLVGGRRRPVVGNVCMDQILVWCGDAAAQPGDEVVLLGQQGDASVSVDEWADAARTITYEIGTSLTARVPRVYVG